MIALSLHTTPLGSPYKVETAYEKIDPIFGLTTRLWPTMHLVAQVLANKETSVVNDETMARARHLVDQLSEPDTVVDFERQCANENIRVDTEALIQIANAYRTSILLILHHEVLDTQDTETLKSVYREAIDSLLRVSALDGPMATYSTSVW
jgi:hypothetical protein